MRRWGLIDLGLLWFTTVLLLSGIGLASIGYVGEVSPGLEGAPMVWVDRKGLFLRSNNSAFALGLIATKDVTLYFLAVLHVNTQVVVWSANKDSPISNSDKFVFGQDGNAFLQRGSSVVWSTDTAGKGVTSMELRDSGNMVLKRDDGSVVWQSFSYPTDTLLSNQEFVQGMKLVGMGLNNLSYVLEMKFGDAILYAAYETLQPYWSMGRDSRKIKNMAGGNVTKSVLVANSWKFYDQSDSLLWQFIFSANTDPKATWIAVLGNDGSFSFTILQPDGTENVAEMKIPANSCGTPQPCSPYSVCYNNNMCRCVSALSSYQGCTPGLAASPPAGSCQRDSFNLIDAGEPLGYFALGFLSPTSTTDLVGCKASCLGNCSCLVLFYQDSTRNCYLLDDVGAFEISDNRSGFSSYIKVSKGAIGRNNGKGHITVVVIIVVVTAVVILGMVYVGFRLYGSRRTRPPQTPQETSEEDTILVSLGGMPIRLSYQDLQTATNNFTTKLGQGGFGSVYRGVLPDGTRLAVKKLEGIGQGKKEFRAEVCIIGSIHHHHLVRLKGFCAEGSHRLLAYEFMPNGSLDQWIFKRGGVRGHILDWETRFGIAVGTAKGLAYLHEDCDVKIVHCDIKPENVLLDENFIAKVSDFGLAKLMTREQSNVFTTLRGTRGYLAPEWLTNYAISEKSDVYSYGMLLLEIIGGRKNYDPSETSERSYFPSYAFRMMERGRLSDVLDLNLDVDENDERIHTAVKVALWCIQEDMHLRPPMTKVVQMLEGLCHVPQPPVSSPFGGRLNWTLFKSTSEEGTTSSGPSDCNSDAHLSAVRLSGPR